MGSILRRPTFSATSPHFVTVIVNDTSRDIKLIIPNNFVIKYGEDLSNSVSLKLPSGSEREVELTRCNGKVWFEKGWPEFSKFCSLDYGHFLVFRYEGNSIFQVFILDTSCTEIDYPITVRETEKNDDHDGAESDDDLSIEILEDVLRFPKTGVTSHFPGPRPSKKSMRTNWCGEAADMVLENDGIGSSTTQRLRKGTTEALCRMHPLNKNEKDSALQRVSYSAYKSEKPHFKVVMQPSYVYKNYLAMPMKFFRTYLIEHPARSGNVTLRVSDGKSWSVKFEHKKSRPMFLHGWLAFVKDNNLKVGDVCVFVLNVNCIELSFEVFSYPSSVEAENFPSLSPGHVRGSTEQTEDKKRDSTINVKSESDWSMDSGNAISRPSPLDIGKNKMPKNSKMVTQRPRSSSSTPRVNILEDANKFISNNPFFKVSLKSCQWEKSHMRVPEDFVKSFIKSKKQTVMLQVRDKSWRVKLNVYNSMPAFSGGIAAFSQENGLKEGDICIFELIETTDIVLKVHIYRC